MREGLAGASSFTTPAKAGIQCRRGRLVSDAPRIRARRNWTPAFAGVVMSMGLALSNCATAPTGPTVTTSLPVAPAAASVPPADQFLYGSGEAGALQLTAFHALIAYANDKAAHRPANSVILAAGSPLVHASFVPCGDKPLAAVFDAEYVRPRYVHLESAAGTQLAQSRLSSDAARSGGVRQLARRAGIRRLAESKDRAQGLIVARRSV